MKNFLIRLSLFAGLLYSDRIVAEHADLSGMVSGSNVIYMDYKSDGKNNSTDLTFTTQDVNLKPTGSTVVTVKGVTGKFCTVKAFYSPDNSNELIAMQVTLREKMFSKTGTVVRVTPDFKIQCQYTYDNSKYAKIGVETDDAYFEQATVPCFPLDHMFFSTTIISNFYAEQDAYSHEGGLLYLRHKINEEDARALTLKHDDKINSCLYYFKPVDGVIRKMWKFDLEEERILGYKIYCFGNIGYLFTTSLEGKKQNPKAEVFESRMRMFDVQTGEIYWSTLIPPREGYEYFVSGMAVDLKSENVFVALNALSTEEKINLKKDGDVRTSFVLARFDKEGNCTTQDSELKWTESQVSFAHTKAPLLLVRNVAVLANGNVQVAGVFAYWREDLMVDPELEAIGVGPTLNMSIIGLQVSLFSGDLKPIGVKQYLLPEAGIKDPLVMYEFNSPRQVLMGTEYHNSTGGSRAYWDPETETLVMLQLSPQRDVLSKKRDYYALKVVSGEKKFFDHVGQTQARDANDVTFHCPAYLLSETTLYYATDLNGAKDPKRFDIPN